MIDIHREPNAITAAKHAAEAVEAAINVASPVLFLLSGGSPLEIIKYLKPVGDQVTVTVSDDRFSTDPAINNFAQIQSIGAEHWIDTRPLRGESLKVCGERFDAALKQWVKNNPQGKIVMTQGIGLDGHTVGMIGKIFDNPNVWVVGYEAENKYPLRVTTTLPFLRIVDQSILYVCGEEKRKPLKNMLDNKQSILHQMKHCLLFTDLTL